MKKQLLTYCLTFIALTSMALASSFVKTDKMPTEIETSDLNNTAKCKIAYKNNTMGSINYAYEVDVLELAEGHQVLICDFSSCYEVFGHFESSGSAVLLGGETTPYDLHYIQVDPDGEKGLTKINFTIKNVDNAEDKESVEVIFNFIGTGIAYVQSVHTSAGPNPAFDYLTVYYDAKSNADLEVKVFDAQGNEVSSSDYAAGSTELTVNTNTLSSGTYYYVVLENGVVKSSNNFVIAR